MLRFLFVLPIFLVGIIAAFRSCFGALLFYIWFALFMPQQWLWIDISPYRPSLIIGCLLIIVCLFSKIMPNISHIISMICLAFLLSCIVSNAIAINSSISSMWLEAMIKLILVCLLLVSIVISKKQFIILLSVIGASFGFHSVKAGFMPIISGSPIRYADGLAGAFYDNNAYALGTVMIMFILLAVAQNVKSRWIAAIFYLSVPLSVVTVVFTYSRAAFLALVIACLFWAFLQKHKFAVLAALLILVIVALIIIPIPDAYKQRIESIRTYNEIGETSALSRIHFWKTALRMAEKHPFGIGLWCFESAYDSFDTSIGLYGNNRSVHNSFLQALVETGWLGGLAYSALLAAAIIIGFKIRSKANSSPPDSSKFFFTMSNALLASIIAFATGGFFISMAYNDLIWIIIASIASLDRIYKSHTNVPLSESAAVSLP
jgi:putative inorganic carbon (hco3(-)) transporter